LAQLARTQALVTNLLNHFMEDGPGFLAEHGKAAPSVGRRKRMR
jgi:hypothetical protein